VTHDTRQFQSSLDTGERCYVEDDSWGLPPLYWSEFSHHIRCDIARAMSPFPGIYLEIGKDVWVDRGVDQSSYPFAFTTDLYTSLTITVSSRVRQTHVQ